MSMAEDISALPRARSLAIVKTPAQLIEDANAALTRAARLSEQAIDALFPIASRLEEDLYAFSKLQAANVGQRERARALSRHIAVEMECIARMAGSTEKGS